MIKKEEGKKAEAACRCYQRKKKEGRKEAKNNIIIL